MERRRPPTLLRGRGPSGDPYECDWFVAPEGDAPGELVLAELLVAGLAVVLTAAEAAASVGVVTTPWIFALALGPAVCRAARVALRLAAASAFSWAVRTTGVFVVNPKSTYTVFAFGAWRNCDTTWA